MTSNYCTAEKKIGSTPTKQKITFLSKWINDKALERNWLYITKPSSSDFQLCSLSVIELKSTHIISYVPLKKNYQILQSTTHPQYIPLKHEETSFFILS